MSCDHGLHPFHYPALFRHTSAINFIFKLLSFSRLGLSPPSPRHNGFTAATNLILFISCYNFSGSAIKAFWLLISPSSARSASRTHFKHCCGRWQILRRNIPRYIYRATSFQSIAIDTWCRFPAPLYYYGSIRSKAFTTAVKFYNIFIRF